MNVTELKPGNEIVSLNGGVLRYYDCLPGNSINTPYTDHFRITTLPDPDTLHIVFDRIDDVLVQRA